MLKPAPEKRGSVLCNPREETGEDSVQERLTLGLSTWSYDAQSANASKIPQNEPGLHPVLADAGMHMGKQGNMKALVLQGLEEGILYMLRPGEY